MKMIAMQKSPNKHSVSFLLIGNPENRRVSAFCDTAESLGHERPVVWPYIDLLRSSNRMPAVPPNSIVKMDSPGENDAVRQLLIHNQSIPTERGLIENTRPWYTGYCALLDWIDFALASIPLLGYMNCRADIKLAFNKPACQAFLAQNHIPVPAVLPPVHDYAHLLEQMRKHRQSNVFIKPAHASSASGVIAFRKVKDRVQAITSAKMTPGSQGTRLYNSLAIQTYTREQDIATLIDYILTENAIVEEWLPKATIDNYLFDIRVLTIAGKARHTVLRKSRHPITNLHLGNKRGTTEDFIAHFGQEKLREIHQLAEKTAACFPRSLYLGIDILLTANQRHIAVLEVNAFGDLLPGLIDGGETCYEAQIQAALRIFMPPTAAAQ